MRTVTIKKSTICVFFSVANFFVGDYLDLRVDNSV